MSKIHISLEGLADWQRRALTDWKRADGLRRKNGKSTLDGLQSLISAQRTAVRKVIKWKAEQMAAEAKKRMNEITPADADVQPDHVIE